MPFDFGDYEKKCDGMSKEQLHLEWENYTREISGGAASTVTSVLLSPLTAGISLVGLGVSAPQIHNARKKGEIIDAGLKARGTVHHTRTRDVYTPIAVQGAVLGKTYDLYSRENSQSQDNHQQQLNPEQPYDHGPQTALNADHMSHAARPGVHTFQTWPQDNQDLTRHGYEPTPLPISTHGIVQQELSEQIDNPASPQAGIHHSKTWPLTYEAHVLTQGANLRNDAKAQNKRDLKGGKGRRSSANTLQNGLSRVRSIIIKNINGPPMTMTEEQEVLFLRGRLLQLEMAKRGEKAKIVGCDLGQTEQSTQVQVLIDNENETGENFTEAEGQSDFTTTSLFWNEAYQPHMSSNTIPPTFIHTGNYLSSPLSASSTPQSAYQAYENSQYPSPPYSFNAQPNTSGSQLLHTVPEHQSRTDVPTQEQPCTNSHLHDKENDSMKSQHRKESQDSAYYSADSTPTAYAPPSFGLPPTLDISDDPFDAAPPGFGLPPETVTLHPNEQDFGLPPKTVTPHLSDSHHIDSILTNPSSFPIAKRSLDFQSSIPPAPQQAKKDEHIDTNTSLRSFSQGSIPSYTSYQTYSDPEGYGQGHRNSQPGVLPSGSIAQQYQPVSQSIPPPVVKTDYHYVAYSPSSIPQSTSQNYGPGQPPLPPTSPWTVQISDDFEKLTVGGLQEWQWGNGAQVGPETASDEAMPPMSASWAA